MKHKVIKYLSSKSINSYTQVDFILKMYIDGEIENELTKYNFYDIEIFNSISKKNGNTIQLNFKYYNLVGTIDFFEEGYNYVVYPIEKSLKDIEDLFVECKYQKDFSINNLINLIYCIMKKHSSLKDNTIERKKEKKYKIISNICLFLPILISGIIALYGIITKTKIVSILLWLILFIVLPLIFWAIFYNKSKK